MTNVECEIRFFDFGCSIFRAVIRHSVFEIVVPCRQTTGVAFESKNSDSRIAGAAFEITVAAFESTKARFESAATDFGTGKSRDRDTEVPCEIAAAASVDRRVMDMVNQDPHEKRAAACAAALSKLRKKNYVVVVDEVPVAVSVVVAVPDVSVPPAVPD